MLSDPGEKAPERKTLRAFQGSNRRAGIAIIWIAVHLLLICWPAVAATENEVRRVLIIYQDSSVLTSSVEIATGISQGLQKVPTGRLDLYTEYLDTPRFSSDDEFHSAADYLRSKYKKLQISTLVTIGPEALRFALKHRGLFAPSATVVFGDISERSYNRLKPPEDSGGLITAYDIGKTVDLAISLQSDADNVVVFSGSAAFDAFWEGSARNALGNNYRSLPVSYVSGLPLPGFVEKARSLSSRTILLILTIFEDSAGQKYRPREAVLEIAPASGAPSYGLLSSYVGTGIVGGNIATYESLGHEVADLIVKIADGASPTVIRAASYPVVDWRSIQRWRMNGANLPDAAKRFYFKPSVWDEYRWQIIAVAILLVSEALAILALYAERRNRIAVEGQSRRRLLELVHMNQSATAGALSASIAHELNQPLGAILSNAEAAEAILSCETPDLDIVRQILTDIREDDQRAGNIILRLRGLLKKRDAIDWQEFDLNEVVDSAINILHAEAAKKRVAVRSEQSKLRLPVRADMVHLQQVILNLATNAMDAMVDAATPDRKLILQTTLHDDKNVEMSISDTGQGIPKERLDSIFDAFYTTKPNGTGLGLSIARAIVETYGGKIWADNRADGGAVFRFVLPLSGAA